MKRVDCVVFRRALTDLYAQDPCGVLPNALWKTLVQATESTGQCYLGGSPTDPLGMAFRIGKTIPFWWRRCSEDLVPLSDADLLLLHDRDLHLASDDLYLKREAYFRLRHDLRDVAQPLLSDGYHFDSVDCNSELKRVSDFICRCYDDLHPGEDTVKRWLTHPVFDPDLWMWVKDDNDSPVALGIAELDHSCGELSLEWIQVLPAYRRHGLGRAVVLQLLLLGIQKSQFATVSGRSEANGVEGLYRQCGFTGDDVWWVVRR